MKYQKVYTYRVYYEWKDEDGKGPYGANPIRVVSPKDVSSAARLAEKILFANTNASEVTITSIERTSNRAYVDPDVDQ